jgi:hypothetical protein
LAEEAAEERKLRRQGYTWAGIPAEVCRRARLPARACPLRLLL